MYLSPGLVISGIMAKYARKKTSHKMWEGLLQGLLELFFRFWYKPLGCKFLDVIAKPRDSHFPIYSSNHWVLCSPSYGHMIDWSPISNLVKRLHKSFHWQDSSRNGFRIWPVNLPHHRLTTGYMQINQSKNNGGVTTIYATDPQQTAALIILLHIQIVLAVHINEDITSQAEILQIALIT